MAALVVLVIGVVVTLAATLAERAAIGSKSAPSALPYLVLAVGIALTVLLSWLTLALTRSRNRAVRDAAVMDHDRRESEARLNALMEQAPAILWTTDAALVLTSLSGAVVSNGNGSPTMHLGRGVGELFAATSPADAVTVASRTALSGSVTTTTFAWGDRSFEAHVEPLRRDDGTVAGTVGVGLDATERIGEIRRLDAAEQALAESEARFRRLAENARDVVYHLRLYPQWAFDYVSPATADVTGWRPEELYADPTIVTKIFDPTYMQSMDRFGFPDEAAPACFAVRHRDGTRRWIENRATPVYDSTGRMVAIEGIARDVTERKEAEDRLAHQATHDPLTDLPNRTLLIDRIDQSLARSRRSGQPIALLFLDLDHFKAVNDDCGHEAGDQMLAAVAGRLRNTLRPGDTVARLGGDEFVLCCDDVANTEEALAISSRVREVLRSPFRLEGSKKPEAHATASIGVVLSRPDDTPQSLLRAADLAMYRAKQAGRDRVAVHGDDRRHGSGRAGTVAALREALGNGELRLYWQTQIDLTDGGVMGVEALLRWQHPTRGVVAAAAFLDLAGEAGVLVDIGTWAIRAACAQAVRWGAAGPVVSVNVSREQVLAGDLPGVVADALEQSGCPPGRLRLEFSERTFADAEAELERCLVELDAIGVGLDLDDYGTAATTRPALERLPLQRLKIDRSLVMRVGHDPAAAEILRAAVALAHTLGLKAVAEGVESQAQVDQLVAFECDAAQGHLFARPAPTARMAAQLAGAAPARRARRALHLA
ncbi:MAG: EAL domain-containing protein [Acidimicrobiia bacterium]|nr:EAL domain-containing protein [Acidimicrobiia bacterium]